MHLKPDVNVIKLFSSLQLNTNKLECLSVARVLSLILIFVEKAGAYLSGTILKG
jgi:hypothetical protein